jgi:phosphoribosylformylglycinamidine synthase
VSFAVDIGKQGEIITNELKQAGNVLVKFAIPKDEYFLPKYEEVKALYEKIHGMIVDGTIVSAQVLDAKGIVAGVSKMGFGNGLGVNFDEALSKEELFTNNMGEIVAEIPQDKLDKATGGYVKLGTVNNGGIVFGDTTVTEKEMLQAWTSKLEKVFPTKAVKAVTPVESKVYKADEIYVCKHKVARPTVFIPVFPGTNCEYDSTKAFERAGADVVTKVFRNMTAEDIRESVDEFEKAISQAQIIMFPGGFSAGDEPDGSAKFFATAFQNAKIKEAVTKLLNERDGLALGICNGFQALIKLGLVPNGAITGQTEDSPTLTYNTINRHISKMAYVKVMTNKSPWLQQAELGKVYTNPASHGEGRFVANKEWIEKLFANGMVATQYCDIDGNVSMDENWNINGSYAAIEGITSEDGRCLGKMAHSERIGDGVAVNIYGEQDMKIFESGVAYFK